MTCVPRVCWRLASTLLSPIGVASRPLTFVVLRIGRLSAENDTLGSFPAALAANTARPIVLTATDVARPGWVTRASQNVMGLIGVIAVATIVSHENILIAIVVLAFAPKALSFREMASSEQLQAHTQEARCISTY